MNELTVPPLLYESVGVLSILHGRSTPSMINNLSWIPLPSTGSTIKTAEQELAILWVAFYDPVTRLPPPSTLPIHTQRNLGTNLGVTPLWVITYLYRLLPTTL